MNEPRVLTEEEKIAKAVASMKKTRLITPRGFATIVSVVAGMAVGAVLLSIFAFFVEAQVSGAHTRHGFRGGVYLLGFAIASTIGTAAAVNRSYDQAEATGNTDTWLKIAGTCIVAAILLAVGLATR